MADLIITIGAKSKEYTEELNKIKKQTKELDAQLRAVAKTSGLIFAGLAASIGVAVKAFGDFDNELRGVKTLLNENSFGAQGLEKGFAKMRKELLAVAKTMPVSIGAMNKSLFDTVSAGVDAGKAVEVLAVSSKLAVAGLTEVNIATDGITSALNAYGLASEEAENVAAKFFSAQVEGKTTIAELSRFFGRTGATAAAFGVNLDELLASVSAVTAGGVKTASAFTGLNAIFANVSKGSAEAQKEAKRLGIEFNSAALRSKGLAGFLESVTSSANFTDSSIEKLFTSIEAQKVAFALTGSQAEKFAKTVKKLGNETKNVNDFNKAFGVQSKSFNNQIKTLKNNFQVFTILLGEKLAPTVLSIAEGIKTLATNFNNLTDDQLESAAAFLKWGAIISGGISILASVGVAVLGLSAGITALGAAFLPATVSASAFWIALTGPVGIAIAGLAAVTVGAIALFNVFKDNNEGPETLEEINGKLKELKRREEELEETARTNRLGQKNRSQMELEEIQTQIEAIKKLKEEKIKASKDFGTGELLVRPSEESKELFKEFNEEVFGDKEVTILVKEVKEGEEGEGGEAPKEKLDPEQSEKIKQARAEREIQKAINAEAEQEEIEFLQRREDIRRGFVEAEKTKNEEERALEKETLALQREELLEEEKEFKEKVKEEKALEAEEEALLQEELKQLSKEQRDALNEEDINALRDTIQTKREIQAEGVKKEVLEKRKADKKFLADQEKFGKAYALINQAMNSAIFKGNKKAFGELAALQQSSNSTLKGIGKVAAIANIVIKTAESAMNVFNGFSTIPIVGVALGIAGAAATVAFGAEQIGKVKGAVDGALVTGGRPGVDSVPFMLAPGELVAPERNFNEVIEGTARQRGFVKREEAGGEVATAETPSELNITVEGLTDNDEMLDKLIEGIADKVRFENADIGLA